MVAETTDLCRRSLAILSTQTFDRLESLVRTYVWLLGRKGHGDLSYHLMIRLRGQACVIHSHLSYRALVSSSSLQPTVTLHQHEAEEEILQSHLGISDLQPEYSNDLYSLGVLQRR